MKKKLEWIPASKPPKDLVTSVLMKGGNYMVAEGIYWNHADKPHLSGFYLTGAGDLMPAEYVEWWIPEPCLPNDEPMRGATGTNLK